MMGSVGSRQGGIPDGIGFGITHFGIVRRDDFRVGIDGNLRLKGVANHDILNGVRRLDIDAGFGQFLDGVHRHGKFDDFVAGMFLKVQSKNGTRFVQDVPERPDRFQSVPSIFQQFQIFRLSKDFGVSLVVRVRNLVRIRQSDINVRQGIGIAVSLRVCVISSGIGVNQSVSGRIAELYRPTGQWITRRIEELGRRIDNWERHQVIL